MPVDYNPAEVTRLLTEAKEDVSTLSDYIPSCRCSTADIFMEGHKDGCSSGPIAESHARAEQRILANCVAMTNQLEALYNAFELLLKR